MIISEEARKLHEESIVVDLHIDPILQHFLFGYDLREEHHASWKPRKRRLLFHLISLYAKLRNLHQPFFNHIDIPRMVTGGYTFGAFGVHYWPRQSETGWKMIQKQIAYLHQIMTEDDRIILANNPEDIRRAFQQKKLAAFIGVEGSHCLGQDGKQTMIMRLNRMEELYKKHGVRYLTLTHFSKNDAATPAMGIGSNDSDGLTNFGKDLIQQMNEIGMLIDLAHVNNQGILDACKISKKPVIVSHTGLKSRNHHPRNISDEAIKAIANTGGIIGVMFATNFLTKGHKHPSSQIILEHIDYLINLVGEDHAAIGSDFDGWIPSIPADMQDATDLIILTQGFLNLGYTHERIKKILGENFLRVWGEVLDI